LRFFTVYGPRQRPDLAIHKFVALLEAGNPIPVFGDGTSGRDYTHVNDILTGILAALEYEPAPANGAKYDVFNLGNSSPVTLNELLKLLECVTGRVAFRTEMPAQPGDVSITWADIAKSTRLLGYRPKTALKEDWKSSFSGIGVSVPMVSGLELALLDSDNPGGLAGATFYIPTAEKKLDITRRSGNQNGNLGYA
jgi:nucleoside-diphosphate-sugar epimerase